MKSQHSVRLLAAVPAEGFAISRRAVADQADRCQEDPKLAPGGVPF